MVDVFVFFLNALSQGSVGGTDQLLLSPEAYNSDLYTAALLIHSTAVKPVTSIVLSIMFVLMLASTSARAEGDRELGIRIIAATMFKIAMVFIVAQNAVLLLDALSSIAVTLGTSANSIDVGTGSAGVALGDQLRDEIEDLGMMEQLLGIIVMFVPFLVTLVASVLVIVLVFIRFLQMYILMSFASLPIAFLGHEDTKPIGIGYLKAFASVAIAGVVIIISVKMFQALLGGWLSDFPEFSGEVLGYIVQNIGKFLVTPLVLIFLLFGANGLAKKVVGEG